MAEDPVGPGQVGLNYENYKLVHDIASIHYLCKVDGTSYNTLQLAVCSTTGIFSSQTPGHKIVEEEPPIIICPFVLELTDGQNFIIGSVKHRNDQAYFYGVPSSQVKDFSENDEKHYSEPKFWVTLKATDERISCASVLANTASAKLLDNFVKILKLTPMFAAQKLTSPSAFLKWCNERSFKDVIKAVCLQAEKLDRGVAQGSAASAGLANDSKERWKAAADAILTYKTFYEEAFARRFLIFENPDALEAVVSEVAGTPLGDFLEPALRAHAARGSGLSSVPANTPLKKLLDEPPPPKPMPTAAAAAANPAAAAADADAPAAAPAAAADAAADDEDGDDDAAADAADAAHAAGTATDEVEAAAAGAKGARKRTPTNRLQPETGPDPKKAKKPAAAAKARKEARKATVDQPEVEVKPLGRPPKAKPTEASAATLKRVDDLLEQVRLRG